jgi:flagellar biosynthesis protein FliR
MSLDAIFNEAGLKWNLTLVILTTALLAARILPIIIFSPFLGGEILQTEVKLGLALGLAIVLFPAVSAQMQGIPLSTVPFIGLMLKEVFVGICLAFVVDMVFDAARSAGHLLDTAAGANMAQVMVPQIQQQATIFSVLQYQLAITFFLLLNGHHVVINALADSFVALPLDRYPALHTGTWPFFELITRVFGDMLTIAMALAAPGLLGTFLTDLALGMINRVAPQIQVFFISMSIKPAVAALMILLTAAITLDRLNLEFQHMLARLSETLRLLS